MKVLTSFLVLNFSFFIAAANAADLVQRNTVSNSRAISAPRANTTARMPTVKIAPAVTETVTDEPIVTEPEITETIVDAIAIDNKSSQFDTALGGTNTGGRDAAGDALADMIRKQRAALDYADNAATAAKTTATAMDAGLNACDSGLRTCMKKTCGNDFLKCAGDGDTIWGNKLDTCKRDLKCTGEEFTMFAREIKADRDHNSKLESYRAPLRCGNEYNECIIGQCGSNFNKCLGKSAGDAAIAKCGSIAESCIRDDNGLANRTMQVFGMLRTAAEVQVVKDEARLYELRKQMSDQCRMLGALFDERSLDCVYTANLFAGDPQTLYASKKLYAGDNFDCKPEWFGIDITTYMENAQRLTREAKGASSALMGAGLGVAAGALSSGAISRAMDTAKAEKAVKVAKGEQTEDACAEYGADVLSHKDECSDTDAYDKYDDALSAEKKAAKKVERDAKKERCKDDPDAEECKGLFKKVGGAIGGAASKVGSAVKGVFKKDSESAPSGNSTGMAKEAGRDAGTKTLDAQAKADKAAEIKKKVQEQQNTPAQTINHNDNSIDTSTVAPDGGDSVGQNLA